MNITTVNLKNRLHRMPLESALARQQGERNRAMKTIKPVVRHMLLCEDVQLSPTNSRKVNVFGLLSAVRVEDHVGAFPLQHSFCVYLMLTGGRGAGDGQIVVIHDETQEFVYVGTPHRITFDPNPLSIKGVIIRVPACDLPTPGLYWVCFRYNDEVIAQEPFEVR
jgi:hypothetical protein